MGTTALKTRRLCLRQYKITDSKDLFLSVTAWCASENIGSVKAMEKAGMKQVGIEKDALLVNSYPLTMEAEELEAIYNIENRERDLTAYFEEFEKHGSVFKISKDGVVRGTISVAKYNGSWYWKSEVIDESQERDGTWPEYIQPLPASLSEKIVDAEKNL